MAFFYLQENDQIQATGKDLKVKKGKGIQEILLFPKIQKDLEDKPEDHIQEVWVLEDKRFDLFLTESKKYDEAAAQLAEAQKGGNPEDIKAAQDHMRKVLNEGLGKKEDDSVDPIPQGTHKALIECIGFVNKRTFYLSLHDLKKVQDERGKKNFRFVTSAEDRKRHLSTMFEEYYTDSNEGKADDHTREVNNADKPDKKGVAKWADDFFGEVKYNIVKEWKFGEEKAEGQVKTDKIKDLIPNPIVQEFLLSEENCKLIDSAVAFFNDTAQFSVNQKEQKRKHILELLDKKDGEFSHYHWGQVLIGIQEIWGKANPEIVQRFNLKYEIIPLSSKKRISVQNDLKSFTLPPILWDASGGAQVMRYTANAGGAAGFDFAKGSVYAKYAADAKLSLLEAGVEANVYLPDDKGFSMELDIPVRKEKWVPRPAGTSNPDTGTRANFALDSFFVLPGAIVSSVQKLEELLFRKAVRPDIKEVLIKVLGHTDATGSHAYNQTLGELRARATFEVFADNYSAWYGYFKEAATSKWNSEEEDFMRLCNWIVQHDPAHFHNELIATPIGNDERMIDILKRLYTPIVATRFPHGELRTNELIQIRESSLKRVEEKSKTIYRAERIPITQMVSPVEQQELKIEYKNLVAEYFYRTVAYAVDLTGGQIRSYREVFYHDCVSLPYLSKGEHALLEKVKGTSAKNRRIELQAHLLTAEKYTEQEALKLGHSRFKFTGRVSCFVGATLSASAEIDITTCNGVVQMAGKKKKEDQVIRYNGREVQPTQEAKNNITAKAEAFAGAKAEASLAAALEWQSPEKKAAEFGILASVGGSVTGTAGAGIEGEFKIGFDQQSRTFQIKMKAQATWGFGGGGAICVTVGVDQLWEFATLVYRELQKHDFNFIDIFENVTNNYNEKTESEIDVYKLYNSWVVEQFMEGKVLTGSVGMMGSGVLAVYSLLDDINGLIRKWNDQNREKEELERMIGTLRERPRLIRYLSPEAKGRLLFYLCRYKEITWSDFSKLDFHSKSEEAAVDLITNGITSPRDWQETMEHMAIRQGEEFVLYDREKSANNTATQKAVRAKDNVVYLRNQLLDEPEDWDKVERHLQSLGV